LTEKTIGFNLHKMIHGEEKSREIAAIERTRTHEERKTTHSIEHYGKVVLSGFDVSMEVYVDGVKTDYVGSLKIILDKEANVVIKRSGYLPFSKTITLTKDLDSTVVVIPELERARTGLLTTSQNYTAGSKIIYEESGQMVEKPLPFKDMPIPEGTYQAKIVNPILGTEKKVEFQIEENKKHFLE